MSTLKLLSTLQKKAPYNTVESATAETVNKIMEARFSAFGFTARGRKNWYNKIFKRVSKLTRLQLEKVGIDFSKGHTSLPENKTYVKGNIIYAQNEKKGDVFKTVFKDAMPKGIIFVDDGLHHIEGVQRAAAEMGVGYIGLHYVRADMDQKDTFNEVIANVQLEALIKENRHLSEDEAKQRAAAVAHLDPIEHFKSLFALIPKDEMKLEIPGGFQLPAL